MARHIPINPGGKFPIRSLPTQRVWIGQMEIKRQLRGVGLWVN